MDGMNAEGHGEQCEWTRESSKEFGRDDLKIGYDMLYNAKCVFPFFTFFHGWPRFRQLPRIERKLKTRVNIKAKIIDTFIHK